MYKPLYLIKKALCAAAAAAVCAAALMLPVRAEGFTAVLLDKADFLTEEDERQVYESMQQAAQNAGCNLLLEIGEDISGGSERAHAEGLLDSAFGRESDSVALFLAANTEHDYDDWLSASGKCGKLVGDKSAEVLTAVYSGLDSGGWKGAALSFCAKTQELMTGAAAAEENAFTARLADLQGVLSQGDRSELISIMEQTAADIGCNVGVVITDYLGGKSDSGYADDFLDESFGFGANAVVLLFNNDRSNMSYTDWISTCGHAQEKFNSRTDDIFDRVYNALGEDNYYSAINAFCGALSRYGGAHGGVDFKYDSAHDSVRDYEVNCISAGFSPTVVALLITIAITRCLSMGYKKKKPVNAAVYCDAQRTRITHRSDVFVRQFTTRVSTSSSGGGRSGGHHSGGGGHHSRSHSSHGGGGGRRR